MVTMVQQKYEAPRSYEHRQDTTKPVRASLLWKATSSVENSHNAKILPSLTLVRSNYLPYRLFFFSW